MGTAITSLQPGTGSATRYSRRWVLLSGLVGLGLAVVGVEMSFGRDSNVIPELLINAGVSILLFAALYVVQHELIERAVLSTVRALSRAEAAAHLGSDDDPMMPGDFLADTGPMTVANLAVEWLASGDYETAWQVFDPILRRSRGQAWVFNNVRQLGLADENSMEAALSLILDPEERHSGMRREFVKSEAEQFRKMLASYSSDKFGWSHRRRVVGPRHEMVLAIPLDRSTPYGMLITGPTMVSETVKVLVGCFRRPEGLVYLVSGINLEAPPRPGWPPSWWIVDDPVATAAHPGVPEGVE